ncbi:phosphatase PAP2 family protein [Leucobacter viscericola]|uniref:Phosphatase PAP2 family protein n=1 Tax=Leucobacter viscericola TaxID=2714935 RepID=A0A6G7XBE8_9MICO|nr:phosphatase PAP2 family protein [Leucobacter viscericola]QIK61883.1 phosphatase PAP2 family protein [Leucobacter viscericola]
MSGALTSRRLRALWSTLFWAALGVGSYVFGVQSALGQEAEASVLEAARFTTDPPAPLNLVSTPSVGVALLAIGILAWIVHGIVRAVGIVVISALAILASQLLKLQLLDRPGLFELDAANTFPSGHMTVFTVLVAAIIWAVPTKIRAIVALVGAAILSAVGWQLLAYGWHRPSDVLGAIALGIVAFAIATLIRPSTSRGTPLLTRTVSIGMAMLSWTLIAAAIVLAVVSVAASNQGLLLNAGQFGVIGTSILGSRSLFRLST